MLLINNRSRSNKTIEKWHKVKAIERWLKRVGGQNFGLKNRAPGGFAHEGGGHQGVWLYFLFLVNLTYLTGRIFYRKLYLQHIIWLYMWSKFAVLKKQISPSSFAYSTRDYGIELIISVWKSFREMLHPQRRESKIYQPTLHNMHIIRLYHDYA